MDTRSSVLPVVHGLQARRIGRTIAKAIWTNPKKSQLNATLLSMADTWLPLDTALGV